MSLPSATQILEACREWLDAGNAIACGVWSEGKTCCCPIEIFSGVPAHGEELDPAEQAARLLRKKGFTEVSSAWIDGFVTGFDVGVGCHYLGDDGARGSAVGLAVREALLAQGAITA